MYIPKRTFSFFARATAVLMTAVLLGSGSHAGSSTSSTMSAPGLRLTGPGPLNLAERLAAGTVQASFAPEDRPSAALRDRDRPKPTPPPRPSKVLPVPGAITGFFGEIRGGGRSHAGIDLDGEIGDPVVSAGAGLVVHAGPPPQGWSGYGTLVVINHPDGTYAMYAHLSAVAVEVGTTVDPGRLIGAIGVSGSVTGSHLHWEIRRGDEVLDPLAWLHS